MAGWGLDRRNDVKHLTRISQQTPARAGAWHDSICLIASVVVGLLSFMGGSAPGFEYIDDKCFIPQPNVRNH
jgi:hypothetical protein